MDKYKYTDKCLALPPDKQFTTLTNDATISLESKVQQKLQKIKQNLQNKIKKSYTQLDHALVLTKSVR